LLWQAAEKLIKKAFSVIPAKAGFQISPEKLLILPIPWIPAFAGMTNLRQLAKCGFVFHQPANLRPINPRTLCCRGSW
jgi:hypothetical protein